jgi:hypothetical protein
LLINICLAVRLPNRAAQPLHEAETESTNKSGVGALAQLVLIRSNRNNSTGVRLERRVRLNETPNSPNR